MNISLFLIIFGIMFGFPVFTIIGIFMLVNSLLSDKSKSNNQHYRRQPRDERGRFTTYDSVNAVKRYSGEQLDLVFNTMNQFFSNHESYAVTRQLNLRSRRHINDISDIDVYFENTYLCHLREFSQTHPNEFEKIMNSLLEFAKSRQSHHSTIDADFKEVDKRQPHKKEEQVNPAEKFAKQVDDFNNKIPDYRISLKLDKTSGLLRQISTLEAKNEGSDLASLQKLYDYYMPMLNDILSNFVQLQDATTHHDHDATVDKVSDVIDTINDSMQTIINDMNDEDFINLNASLNTLETLLKNDGLVTDSKLDLSKTKAKAQAESQTIQLTLDPNTAQEKQEAKDQQIKMELDDKIGQINNTFKSDAQLSVKE